MSCELIQAGEDFIRLPYAMPDPVRTFGEGSGLDQLVDRCLRGDLRNPETGSNVSRIHDRLPDQQVVDFPNR